jgi:hypothetical protein
MLYEVRTYTVAPGDLAEFERGFAEAIPHRTKYSPLGAFWRSEFGPMNQAIHVWPYEDLVQRDAVRAAAAKDPNWPPKHSATLLEMTSEICVPAPFMRDLDHVQELGNVYEMRTYTYRPGAMPKVLDLWADAIAHREKYSPLAACWYTEFGVLNRFTHIWPYESLEARARIRAESMKDPHWPAPTREFIVSQETRIMTPAPFSPLR